MSREEVLKDISRYSDHIGRVSRYYEKMAFMAHHGGSANFVAMVAMVGEMTCAGFRAQEKVLRDWMAESGPLADPSAADAGARCFQVSDDYPQVGIGE